MASVDEVQKVASDYYTADTRDDAKADKLFDLSPEEASSSGYANGYIHGIGCVDQAYGTSTYD